MKLDKTDKLILQFFKYQLTLPRQERLLPLNIIADLEFYAAGFTYLNGKAKPRHRKTFKRHFYLKK